MKFKGTKGEWSCIKNNSFYEVVNHCDYKDGDRKFTASCHINVIGEKCMSDSLGLENEANAKLIADAGTTINKCDLMPSELLEQRNELLEALQSLLEISNSHVHPSIDFARGKAKQAIKKALT